MLDLKAGFSEENAFTYFRCQKEVGIELTLIINEKKTQ